MRALRRVPSALWACTFYLLAAVGADLPAWTHGLSSRSQADGGDIAIFVWSLRWTAFALVHGHNPLYSNWINVPGGVNLLDNTSCLLLGVIAAPLTLSVGAMASFNVLHTLAFASSAAAAYALLRRWTSWAPAAFVGGLVYGFSPYMVSAGWAHLHSIFLPLPPLMLLCLDGLAVRQVGSAVRRGVGLGLLVAAQFFISTEVLADTAELCGLGLVVLALLHRSEISTKVRYAATGMATAGGVAATLLAYPAWFAVFGPEHGKIVASARLASRFSTDLLGPVVPTSNQLLSTGAISRVGDRLSGGLITYRGASYLVTNGVYLGLPLLVLLVIISVHGRRQAIVRFFAVMTGVALVASLGPALKVNGHVTGLLLPERILHHLPLLEATYPYRYGPYVALGSAVLLAVGLDQLRARSPRLTGAFIACALIPLVPALPYAMVKVSTPRYFRSVEASAISRGSVVLTFPPPTPFTSDTMMWQADAGLRFRMVGAYLFARDSQGGFTLAPNQSLTERALYDIWAGLPPPMTGPELAGIVGRDVVSWRVSTVVVVLAEPHSEQAVTLFTEVIGRPPQYQQDAAVWYQASSGIRTSS